MLYLWRMVYSSALLGENVRDEFGRNELECADHEDFCHPKEFGLSPMNDSRESLKTFMWKSDVRFAF